MSNKIREYRTEDLDSLWNLYLDSIDSDSPCPFWQFRDVIERGRTYVFEYTSPNGRISPKAFLISFIDEGSPWIWYVCTIKYMRRVGIAGLLLDRVEKYYRELGHSEIKLYVHQNNAAQTIYFNHGYRTVFMVPGIYQSGVALEMVKNL